MLGPAARAFRDAVLDRLDDAGAPDRFAYISADVFVHRCPVCASDLPEYLAVRFRGKAPAADLVCSRGCPESEIAAALGFPSTPPDPEWIAETAADAWRYHAIELLRARRERQIRP